MRPDFVHPQCELLRPFTSKPGSSLPYELLHFSGASWVVWVGGGHPLLQKPPPCFRFSGLAAYLVYEYAPTARGSGIPEVKAAVSGYDLPLTFSGSCLLIKDRGRRKCGRGGGRHQSGGAPKKKATRRNPAIPGVPPCSFKGNQTLGHQTPARISRNPPKPFHFRVSGASRQATSKMGDVLRRFPANRPVP